MSRVPKLRVSRGKGRSLWLANRHERSAPQTATALHEVFKVVKTMQTEGLNWGEGCRPPDRQAVAKIVEGVDR